MEGNMHDYTIRSMTSGEVRNIAIRWAAEEGWNPGLHDAEVFYRTDSDGFYVGLLDGEAVSCISAVSYEGRFGFIGFYIVKPEFRGKGYGIKIWGTALQHLHGQNTGLDGVSEQQSNYARSGFRFAYRNIRFEGISRRFSSGSNHITGYKNEYLENLIRYDTLLFPAARPEFLKCWTSLPESKTFISMKDEKISGYCTVRKCQTGYKIGPLFAGDSNTAEDLFIAVNNHLPENTVYYLDAPEVNQDALVLAEKYSMDRVFETARMYTMGQPDICMNHIYGVTTFELG